MSNVYARQVATVKRLIAKYGQQVTWKSITEGTAPDATKPWVMGSSSISQHTPRIAFFPDDKLFKESQHLVKVSNRGDEFVEESVGSVVGYMGAVTFTPSVKDVVARGSVEYRISSLKELNVNGESILWIIEFLL